MIIEKINWLKFKIRTFNDYSLDSVRELIDLKQKIREHEAELKQLEKQCLDTKEPHELEDK